MLGARLEKTPVLLLCYVMKYEVLNITEIILNEAGKITKIIMTDIIVKQTISHNFKYYKFSCH